ncbi:MAG: endolytic transglycosylase MltG [bacterium]
MSAKRKHKKKESGIRYGIILLVLLAVLSSAFFYVVFLRPATSFNEDQITILIPSKQADKSVVKEKIKSKVKKVQFTTFLALAEWSGYWKNIKAGRYTIRKNSSIFSIFRMLNGGRQHPVSLTINKYRTKKDLIKFVSTKFEFTERELSAFISNNDSIKQFGIRNETFMTVIIPNTYEIYWNITPKEFINRMYRESEMFWNENRREKAKRAGLSNEEVYTLASIIEEETNDDDEKPIMASVYLNRLKKGMTLGADPTIKFAIGDFTIRRITGSHIKSTSRSPYNTYTNKGLPPGPICTPSITTIDAVLNHKETAYLYFCAKEDFSGSHNFAETAEEHIKNARKYRRALDSLRIR